jgi:ABC-2 type transport system ATP-binding protein
MEGTDAARQFSWTRICVPRNGVVYQGGETSETATMTPVVELVAVRKRYGAIEALRGVDLCIRPGEVVALLGPNGAGKTTTISLMLGLRRPTSGSALLFGLDPTDRRARSRAGVMLQESGVMGVLTVRETIRLFRAYYPHPLPLGEILALAGLEEVADRRVARLSGGQCQRLYFALAICGDPEALFLDEPTVGMDVEARRAFLAGMRTASSAGKTIVLTTHYLEEADALAERIVVIDRGVVIADAPPHALKARVASKSISFSVAMPLDDDTLAGLPVMSVQCSGSRVRLLSNTPEAVLRVLFERGVALVDLEVTGADLEDAFLALTRREED